MSLHDSGRDALRLDLIAVIDGEYEGNETDGQIADRMIAVFEKHDGVVRPAGVPLTREDIRKAVQPVLWNASNYPRKAQPHILGQDIAPLIGTVVDALAARLEEAAQ